MRNRDLNVIWGSKVTYVGQRSNEVNVSFLVVIGPFVTNLDGKCYMYSDLNVKLGSRSHK